MKRYLVTLTGRANCIYGKLRGNELVCSYVHANSKKKAIELLWGELEKNENFYCYSRRDFKIEAELWNENELDHYGNPLKDWESAIDFSNLHLIRFNHCTGKYEILSAEMEKAEQIKSEEAHQLAQAVAQMDADQVCSIVEETLKEQKEIKEATEKLQHDLSSTLKLREEKRAEWRAQAQKEAQESSEPVAQENIQPEPEDATESISEPQEDADALEREKAFQKELAKIRKRKEKLIPREMIDAYNRLSDSLEGTSHYAILKMYHEYKDIDGKFKGLSWGLPREHMITIDGEEFYIKKIRGEFWLYWEFRGDVERWCLTDHAKAYFNIVDESIPEPSQSSSDEEKEITKEYKTMGNTERCQNLWKQIEALDEEFARVFIN